ncbi:hypothetical protein F4804DRAFT_343661 [Jackrogersella minutella]|nr:hypothetical protein F4804DRAFT_343661 [Jackrogersella minutella]
MPSAQPTCAARIIRNKFLTYGWGAPLTKETNDIVKRVKEDAGAMYQLQSSRDRPITASSLRSALFWEHRHLADQQVVSTPALDDDLEIELFSEERKPFKAGLEKIRKSFAGDSQQVQMRPLFGPIRDRPFTLWPIRIDGVWVTIILTISPVKISPEGPRKYFDRQVTKFIIIDPLPVSRRSRRALIEQRLGRILAEGCISFSPGAVVEGFATKDIEDKWATGLVAYALCREFFRRLRVFTYRRQLPYKPEAYDFIWGEFEEDYDMDAYRQSLMASCAHQAIEKSGYIVRLALEVPSEKSNHNPDALRHTDIDPRGVPDEHYTTIQLETRNVVVEIPEDQRSVGAPEQLQSDLDSDESDADQQQVPEVSNKPELEVAPTAAPGTPTTSFINKDSFDPTPSQPEIDTENYSDTNCLKGSENSQITTEEAQPLTLGKRRLSDAEESPSKRQKADDA